MKTALGTQALVELFECREPGLGEVPIVRAWMLEGVRRGGATIVTDTFHQFAPHGVSGVVILAESHAAIHTWPEHGVAAIDVFTCGRTLDFEAMLEYWRVAFGAGSTAMRFISRPG